MFIDALEEVGFRCETGAKVCNSCLLLWKCVGTGRNDIS